VTGINRRRPTNLTDKSAAANQSDRCCSPCEGKLEIARNAITRGYSVDDIRDLTGLDEATIKDLLNEK